MNVCPECYSVYGRITPLLGTYFYSLWFVLFVIRALRRI